MRGRVTLFIAMRKDILDALFTGAAAFCVGGVCLRRGYNALIAYCNAIKSQVHVSIAVFRRWPHKAA
jgi:hypothetical protein